jgi:hypothetical protein
VHRVFNTAGRATGGTDFVPTQVGLMSKSYGAADQDIKNVDFNYFLMSTVSTTGTKDLTFTLPAGSTPDVLAPLADDAGAISYQVKNSGGTFVGPDGTAGSTFSADEPKMPASFAGITNLAVRATFSNNNAAGTPYLHALGAQYVSGSNRVVRDTNAADFAAGVTKSGVSVVSRPGTVVPQVQPGTPVVENFDSAPSGWLFSNTWIGKNTPDSSVSYTNTPGSAEVSVGTPTDFWAPGVSAEKPRAALYKSTPVTGDFQLDTVINFPSGRDTDRHQGLAIIQANPAGTAPDTIINLENAIVFGPYRQDSIRMMRIDNNVPADFGPAGYTDTMYYLRLVKIGNTFTGYVSTDGTTYTNVASYVFSHDMGSMYVGFMAKAYGASSGQQIIDYDNFKITPLITTGAFESRVLDLGATGLTPLVSQAGNSAGLQIQIRAADTESALASAAYVGPDGTAATSYSGSFNGVLANFAGKRYFQYKVVLTPGSVLNDLAIIGASGVTLPLSRTDAVNILKIAAGITAATPADKTRYDVKADGKVDILDAAQLLRTVNGL